MKRLLALLALALAGCGSSDRDALRTETVGRGPQATTIVRPADAKGRIPVVIFLHGWGGTLPSLYRPWVEHLAREGNAVIYPRYQESFATPPAQALGNMLAGVRLALRRIDEDPRGLVVAGHSAGGALAADYAAIARTASLPVAAGVFSVYPGRRLRGIPFGLPEIDPDLTPRTTRVIALAGACDAVVGTREARRIAERGRYVRVEDAAVCDHAGPLRSSAAARRAFWAPLDRLISRVRAG